MNKWIFSFFSFCLLCMTHSLMAFSGTLEVRTAAFLPLTERFKDVYSDAVADWQVQGSLFFCNHYEAWANYSAFSTSEKRGECYHTTCHFNSGALGLNYVFRPYCNLDYYLGFGLVAANISLYNHSCFFHEHKSDWSAGFLVKSGVRYYFCNNLFLDGFVDYLYQSLPYSTCHQLSGFKIGGGLGIKF